MPRHLRGTTSKTWRISSRACWLPSWRTTRAYWFSTSARPCLQLPDTHQDALQNVQRLEARDDNGHVVFRRDRLIFRATHHRADMARRQETLHAAIGRGQQSFHGRGHQDMRDEHGKILDARAPPPVAPPAPWRGPWSQSRRRRTPLRGPGSARRSSRRPTANKPSARRRRRP